VIDTVNRTAEENAEIILSYLAERGRSNHFAEELKGR